MDGCFLTKEAEREASKTWLCTACKCPRPGTQAVDVWLQEERIEGVLNGVFGAGVGVARRDFLARIGDELVARELHLGRALGPDGRALRDWVSFRGRHVLIIRASKHVSGGPCEACGRIGYFAMGKRYLYPSPVEGVELFESDLWGLVLPEHVFERSGIGALKRQHLIVQRLRVLPFPKDSLGNLNYDSATGKIE